MDAFRWALFGYYIFIGTAQVLLMKASGASAKGTGKSLAYNTASAMIFIEGSKIIFCSAVEMWQGDAYRAEKGEARKTTTFRGFLVYAVPGFLYAVENNLKIPATVFLHPHVFALFNNSKVIFAAVGMVLLLGKRFSVLQWVSMVLLVLSLCVAKVQMLLPTPKEKCDGSEVGGASRRMPEEDAGNDFQDSSLTGDRFLLGMDPIQEHGFFDEGSWFAGVALSASAAHVARPLTEWLPQLLSQPESILDARPLLPGESPRLLSGGVDSEHPDGQSSALFLLGMVLVLAASLISGLAGVFNELLLKQRDTDVGLWRKNIWTYAWGVIFNTLGLLMSSFHEGGSFELFRGYDRWVWAMIGVTALLGISVSMIMKYFDNVVKCFGGSLILYSATLASMLLFGSRVDAGFVLGLLVYSVSSYFYAGDHNQKLATYEKYSAEIEAMVRKAQAAKEMEALKPVVLEERAAEEEEVLSSSLPSRDLPEGTTIGKPVAA